MWRPPSQGKLGRWATDVTKARAEAQRRLVVSVAALGKADLTARASVGDDDPVLAVEDALHEFAASEVILVTGPPAEDAAGERAAAELQSRSASAARARDRGFARVKPSGVALNS